MYESVEEPQLRDSDFRKGCLECVRDRCMVTKAITINMAKETQHRMIERAISKPRISFLNHCTKILNGMLVGLDMADISIIIPWSFASYDRWYFS